jgi:hypothetical protein
MEINETKFKELVNKLDQIDCGFNFEYDGNGDNRIFIGDQASITVHAPTLGKESYEQMEKELSDFNIKKDSYEIIAWNDISGWDYWYNEGKDHFSGCNYIMIQAVIIDIDNVDVKELFNDMVKGYNAFCQYDNFDQISDEYFD